MADNREDDLEVREPEFEHACDCPAGWEDGYYGTGSTKPPKDHGWVVAIVLVLLILCSGLLTALSLMDIHLFHAKEPPEVKTSASFLAGGGIGAGCAGSDGADGAGDDRCGACQPRDAGCTDGTESVPPRAGEYPGVRGAVVAEGV